MSSKRNSKKSKILEPVLHEIQCVCDECFTVFSLIEKVQKDEPGTVLQTWHQCEACELYHRVVDICQSIPSKRLGGTLETYDVELHPDIERAVAGFDAPQEKIAFANWCHVNGYEGEINLQTEMSPKGEIKGMRLSVGGDKIKIYPFRTRVVAGDD